MAFKDILVHIDNSKGCEGRLDLAISLARKHQAHLSGLYVISHPHYTPRLESTETRVAEAQESFSRITTQAGISAEWICADWAVAGVSANEVINRYAYHKDLVIVGQIDHASRGGDIPSDLPERVVLGSGRPVLIVPYAGVFNSVGDRVMMAWKSGRESSRALHDAMPFLENARQVSVIEVSLPGGREVGGMNVKNDISVQLERHGIQAAIDQFVSADIPIADVLLNQAWEKNCDLLVMGAFTNTQRGTLTLGSVTRHILNHMTLPVLMSH